MILGIDLGTTNSLACVFKDGEVVQIPNFMGEYLTPSVVSIEDDGTILVGRPAKERSETNPEKTFASFKRYMGSNTKFGDFTAEELSSFVLKSLKQDAEKFLGEEVEDVIISVPAYFNDKSRNATKNAGTLAGLNVLRIINEPSAAALGYLNKSGKFSDLDSADGFEDQTFLVFDFGGGTLDISLVDTFENVVEILCVAGDNMLGGIDFDRALAKEFMTRKEIKREKISEKTYNSIVVAAERCKRELTEKKQAKMIVHSEEINDELEISDTEYLKICEDVVKRISVPINKVLLDSQKKANEIDGIVLVGGSSKMPIVQQYLKYLMRGMDISVYNPDHMIAYGMGVYAGIMERANTVKDLLLTDVCPFSLGTGIANHQGGSLLMSFIIPRNSALPISKTEIYCPEREGQDAIDFTIYQGEEMYVRDNKRIGNIYIQFPRPASKSTQVIVTFTYDINGILLVNIDIPEMSITREAVIEDPSQSSRLNIEEKVKALKKFKLNSSEDEDVTLIREWGQKLYVVAPAMIKNDIRGRMEFFEYILQKDPYQAIKVKRQIKLFFVSLEMALSQYSLSNWSYEDTWEDDMDEDVEAIFKEWEENEDK